MTRSLVLLLGLLAFACADSRREAGDADESVPLDQVPEVAKTAAAAAMPGVTFTGAEKEVEDGTTVYSLLGEADGKPVEIEVTADGRVTEIEKDGKEDAYSGEADDDD
jgi:hypothetical protein